VILLLRFGVRCTRHWRRSIKSKNRNTKCPWFSSSNLESVAWDIGVDRSRARTETRRESETHTQTQNKRERESCGDNGVLKSAIECAVRFGAHLRFLFLCNSLPFFRGQWSFEECDWMCCRVWRSLALPIPL
jgi:hypothetical protein